MSMKFVAHNIREYVYLNSWVNFKINYGTINVKINFPYKSCASMENDGSWFVRCVSWWGSLALIMSGKIFFIDLGMSQMSQYIFLLAVLTYVSDNSWQSVFCGCILCIPRGMLGIVHVFVNSHRICWSWCKIVCSIVFLVHCGLSENVFWVYFSEQNKTFEVLDVASSLACLFVFLAGWPAWIAFHFIMSVSLSKHSVRCKSLKSTIKMYKSLNSHLLVHWRSSIM